MTRKDHVSFVNHTDYIALIRSTGNITTVPPANTGLADNFKVTHSPADSFKKSIKRYASVFNTSKEGKYWDTQRRNSIVTTRVQDVAEVLNSYYRDVTNDDVKFFTEKQKYMHAVFDKTMQTDRVKKLLREHYNDYDYQSALQKLSSFCTESTNARVSVSTALSFVA